jgi:hypothetical protein
MERLRNQTSQRIQPRQVDVAMLLPTTGTSNLLGHALGGFGKERACS